MTTPEIQMWNKLFAYVNGGTPDGAEAGWSYCGLDVWPVMKAQILMRGSNIFNAGRQMSLVKSAPPAPAPSRFLSSWMGRLRAPASVSKPLPQREVPTFDWPALPIVDRAPDVLCLGYATNHKKFGNNYFQLCMDPLRHALSRAGRTSACFVTGLDDKHEGIEKAAAKDVHGIERQFRAVRNLARQMPPVDLADFPGFARWWDGLNSTLDGQMFVTVEHIETVLKQTVVTGEWLYHQLDQSRPKGVLVSAYYGLMGHGGSWACRRLGIPIADVQHGVAGANHHAYSWPNAPKDGFNCLPTGFLTWSEQEKQEMCEASGAWQQDLLVVGNVWRLLDETVSATRETKLFQRGALAAARKELVADRATITDIKSRTVGSKDILLALHPDEPLPWFERLRKLAPDDWRFWIRLHPGEFKNDEALAARLSALVDRRTFVVEPSLAPLNVILSEVDAVLTKFSSVALDARAYGVPTVAYSEAARVFFGNSELHRIRYVAPYAEQMRGALVQRLSSYAPTVRERQTIEPFDMLGQHLCGMFLGVQESLGGEMSSDVHEGANIIAI